MKSQKIILYCCSLFLALVFIACAKNNDDNNHNNNVNNGCNAGYLYHQFYGCQPQATCPASQVFYMNQCVGVNQYVNNSGGCPIGTIGTYPQCYPSSQCPAGTSGVPPNCVSVGQPYNYCPPGTYPVQSPWNPTSYSCQRYY